MDGQRFDEFTKSLTASGTSRRRVLRGLLGGAVGTLGAALGRHRTEAQGCSAYGRVCTYTGCCRDGATCVCYRNGHCRCLCPEGTSSSNGACVATDPGNQACQTFVCGNEACALRQGAPGDAFPNCYCFEVAETPGQGLCLKDFPCTGTQLCDATSECPGGQTCVVNSCCGAQGRCAPACPPPGTGPTGTAALQREPRGPSASGH